MKTIDGLVLVAAFFAFSVLVATIPGLLIGSIIGKQVRHKVASLATCMATDVLVVSLLVYWLSSSISRAPAPDDSTIVAIWVVGGSIALALPTLLGWWLVRKNLVICKSIGTGQG